MKWYQTVMYVLEGGLLLVLLVGIAHRLLRDYVGKPSQAEAELVKKRAGLYYRFSRYGKLGPSTREEYILEFRVKNKCCKYSVNRVFYESAIEGQRVRITYKGNRLINFEPI